MGAWAAVGRSMEMGLQLRGSSLTPCQHLSLWGGQSRQQAPQGFVSTTVPGSVPLW